MPFPSSGGYTVGQILACMEDFPIGDESAGFGFGSANTLNVMVESMRLAFSSRSVWMGDSDFVMLPEEGLLADGYLDPRCEQISADARIDDDAVVPGDPRPFDPDFGRRGRGDRRGRRRPGRHRHHALHRHRRERQRRDVDVDHRGHVGARASRCRATASCSTTS